MTSIAFVGAGPTTLYTLASLLRHVGPDVSITVFEEQRVAGAGSPYRPDWNDPAMLSNIASFEIPPVSETLLDWLVNLPDQERAGLGIAREDLNERAFYPRVVLGQYFRDQLDKLVQRGREAGAVIRLQTGCSVLDVSVEEGGMLVTTSPRRGVVDRALFDHVVLATGHQWPAQQEVRPGYYVTPWPIEALAQTSPVAVGIRGSSLTAVDVAVVLANQHGAFVEDQDGLTYRPNPGTEGFKLTMMSRKGLLPEADFYFPVPHAPLSICTEAAVEALIARGSEGLLDQAFELFWRELGETDPAYVGTLAFAATPEAFGEAYFAERTEGDPFDRALVAQALVEPLTLLTHDAKLAPYGSAVRVA